VLVVVAVARCALDEGHEWGLGVDGYDALLVEPDALEDQREALALGDGLVSRRQKIVKSSRTLRAWSRSGGGSVRGRRVRC
jgi:hypothetical protein